MEQRFQLLSIRPSLKDKNIRLVFSLDIDEESVPENIYLMQSSPRTIIPCSLETDGKTVTVILRDWPVPNQDYSLVIEPGKILSITEDVLEETLPIRLRFKSEVTSKVSIIAPKNFSEISGSLTVSWKEIGEASTKNYYVEISTENVFCNLIKHAVVEKSIQPDASGTYSASFPEIKESGQYFVRVRAESGKEYGSWSDTVTFVIPKEKTRVPNPQPEETKRPSRPEIVDLTKENAAPKKEDAEEVKRKKIAFEDLPQNFTIDFPSTISIENAVVKIERSVF